MGQGGCSCRGTPEIQTQLEGGLLPKSPPSTWKPHPQFLCKGRECHPGGFSVRSEALCKHKTHCVSTDCDLDFFCLCGKS